MVVNNPNKPKNMYGFIIRDTGNIAWGVVDMRKGIKQGYVSMVCLGDDIPYPYEPRTIEEFVEQINTSEFTYVLTQVKVNKIYKTKEEALKSKKYGL